MKTGGISYRDKDQQPNTINRRQIANRSNVLAKSKQESILSDNKKQKDIFKSSISSLVKDTQRGLINKGILNVLDRPATTTQNTYRQQAIADTYRVQSTKASSQKKNIGFGAKKSG